MVIEKAKRLVEHGRDVVILLDSITRLARAHNAVVPHSGKILTGGVDANALQKPKRFFGAARNIEEGGSLTIIAHRPDRHRQPHGRGDLRGVQGHRQHGARARPPPGRPPHLAGHRHPAQSGTRKEELLMDKDELNRVYLLRNFLADMPPVEAMEFLLERMKRTKNNKEFFATMAQYGRYGDGTAGDDRSSPRWAGCSPWTGASAGIGLALSDETAAARLAARDPDPPRREALPDAGAARPRRGTTIRWASWSACRSRLEGDEGDAARAARGSWARSWTGAPACRWPTGTSA